MAGLRRPRKAYRCPRCGGPMSGNGSRCQACFLADVRAGLVVRRRVPTRGERAVVLPTRQPRPTAALPGTPERVEILAARYAAGELLWSPGDARRDE